MLNAYIYRIYPTSEQKLYLNKTFGCVRLNYSSELNGGKKNENKSK